VVLNASSIGETRLYAVDSDEANLKHD
jgi:hypothetical protein